MQKPLDNLFKFPILMVDGSVEEKKMKLGLPGEEELDIVQGYAECPFQDFVSVTDRWVPNNAESFEKAQQGEFEACFVVFSHSGNFIVPWTRDKFKKKYTEFVNTLTPEPPVIHVTKEQMREILNKADEEEGDGKPE